MVRGFFPFCFGSLLISCQKQQWQCCPFDLRCRIWPWFSQHVCVSSSFPGAGGIALFPLCTCFPWACDGRDAMLEYLEAWPDSLCLIFLSPGKCCFTSCKYCTDAVTGVLGVEMLLLQINCYKITSCCTCYRCHMWGCEGALGFPGCRDNRTGFSHPWLFWSTGELAEVGFVLTCFNLHNQCFGFDPPGPI